MSWAKFSRIFYKILTYFRLGAKDQLNKNMGHKCIIQIDNSDNPHTLFFQSATGPGGSGNPEGSFSIGLNSSTQIPANGTLGFEITRDFMLTAGASMVWTTGSVETNTLAIITLAFENRELPFENNASLKVDAAQSNSSSALLAYGVSHFFAAQGDKGKRCRDHIRKDGMLAHSPLYVHFKIVRNKFIDNPVSGASTGLPGITNVVMLMLENRAFDHLLGMLYTKDEQPLHIFPAGSKPPADPTAEAIVNFDGLANRPGFSNPDPDGEPVFTAPVPPGKYDFPEKDPGEGFLNTNMQVFNSPGVLPAGTANMQGFVKDFYEFDKHNFSQILQYYTPDHLSVISTLAKQYAVSDAWHASLPSQTFPNRCFSLAGTSEGYVNNTKNGSQLDILEVITFGSNTMFNTLSNSGLGDKWAIYYQDHIYDACITSHIFEQLHKYDKTDNVRPYERFLSDIENDTLPPFSYVEPAWFLKLLNGTDYHPPANLCEGENALAGLYTALTKYSKWESTLLIVTFDEHGGTFDHAIPPAAIAPDHLTDWSGFEFGRLGVRVPTLLISPLIAEKTVFRSPVEGIPFDHTSFIKTILNWQHIDVSSGVMGERAIHAPDFSGVLSATVMNEGVTLNPPHCTPNNLYTQPLNDLQRLILPHLGHKLSGAPKGSPAQMGVTAELHTSKSVGELRDKVHKMKTGKHTV
jgi:phospholipase C